MSIELLYTSAPQGLKPSSRGFCTVLSTTGMPVNLATRLEGLSAYRHAFPPNTPEAAQNPVCYSHLKMTVGGQRLSVLSRIADYGVDYSQRTNKIAHHVVVSAAEQAPAGPAWAMLQSRVMRAQWDGQCATPAAGPALQLGNQAPAICAQWAALTGEAGWGAIVAEALAQSAGKPTWIVFSLAQSPRLLGLINEAIALLPERERWQATFSTYVTNLPPDVDCRLRCVLAGTDEARLAPARGTIIDLTQPLPPPNSNRFTQMAIEGSLVAQTSNSLASAASAVASTATPPVAGADAATAYDLDSDAGEIEYVDDDDASPLDTGAFDQKTPPPPPMPKPPKLQREPVGLGSPQQRRHNPQRLYLISAIAACLLLMGGVGIYLAMSSQSVKVVGLSMPPGTELDKEKNASGKAPGENLNEEKGQQEPDAAQAQPASTGESLGSQHEAKALLSDEKVASASASNPPELQTQGGATVPQESSPEHVKKDKTTAPSDPPHVAPLTEPSGPVKSPGSDAESTKPNIPVGEIPATSIPEADDSQIELAIVATIAAKWFDGDDKKVTASGNLALPGNWLDKIYFSDRNEGPPRNFQVGQTVKYTTVNESVKILTMKSPSTMLGTVVFENKLLTSERDKLKQKTKAILDKINKWNEAVNRYLLGIDSALRANNELGIIIQVPKQQPGLSLGERSKISKELIQAGVRIKKRMDQIKESNEQFRSQLSGPLAIVEQRMVGLSDLEQMDKELNESIDHIRRLCMEVNEGLGNLFYLAADNGKGQKPGALVTLKLELSADKKE